MVTIYKCFPQGKHKVLTMSYDDGTLADRRLVEIFNTYGIKGTFHLNAGLMDREDRVPADEVPELYAGHEVACHTYTHPTIERCPSELVTQQILEDRKQLEEMTGYAVRGMSYPNGSYSRQIRDLLPHMGIAYSRIVGNSNHFSMPDDPYAWESTCHHNHNLMELGTEFLSLHKTQYLYMMYIWGHSYEFNRDDNWALIEEFCKQAGGREDIWYATNIEIIDYMDAANRLQFSVSGKFAFNPSVQSIWVSVDGRIVELKGGVQTRL